MEPFVRELSVAPTIVGAIVFLAIGIPCLLIPHAIQQYAVKTYRPRPDRGLISVFMQSPAYVVMVRSVGLVFTAVGLGLAGILIAALLVPGFASFS